MPMIEPLTEREQEILVLITQGMTNQEIAERLFLSLGTVKAHNHNIFGKLDVTNRTQALRRAQELGLIDGDADSPTSLQPAEPLTPIPDMPFVGREVELDQLTSLVNNSQARLITLLGAGGMGKTRLALEIAQRQQGLFRDGVFFVPLAQLTDSQDIATTIIEVLRLQLQNGENAQKQLKYMLQKKSMLLILDNFEHLLHGVDFVLDLLQAAPNLKLLITSRERLNVSMEVTFVLAGLQYQTNPQPSSSSISDASRLFLQYARQARPDFDPNLDDLAAIDRICQLAQGMPLAIVLAAGWADLLSLNEIAQEIAQSIDILQSQMRDVPERQRSMRATIIYSWNRLNSDQKRAFTQLSVFRGSFSRQAAEEIAGAALHTLQILLNRSFLSAHQGRYSIHELLRQFGFEELVRATHAGEIANAHSQYYLSRLYELEADIKGKRQIAALNEIRLDFDNIRQAWRWGIQTEQNVSLEHAVECLYAFALVSGRIQDVIDLLQFLLDHYDSASTMGSARLIDHARRRWLALALVISPERLALTDVELSVGSAQQQDDLLEIGLATDLLASYVAYVEHDYQRAIDLHEQNMDVLRRIHDHFYTSTAYHKMGYCQLQINGLDALIRDTRKSYEIAKNHGNLYNQRASLNNLGSAALYLGCYHEAEQHYRETLPIVQAFGYESSRHEIINFAHILFLLGKFDEGRDLLRTAWQEKSGMLDLNGQSFGHAMNGFLAAVEGRYETALHHALQSLQETLNDVTGTLVANLVAAMAYCGLREPIAAHAYLSEALRLSCQMNFLASITWALPMLVIVQAQQGQFEQATTYAALVRTHRLSPKAWLDHWTLFTDTEALLQDALDEDTYITEWQYGATLTLEEVGEHVLNIARIPA